MSGTQFRTQQPTRGAPRCTRSNNASPASTSSSSLSTSLASGAAVTERRAGARARACTRRKRGNASGWCARGQGCVLHGQQSRIVFRQRNWVCSASSDDLEKDIDAPSTPLPSSSPAPDATSVRTTPDRSEPAAADGNSLTPLIVWTLAAVALGAFHCVLLRVSVRRAAHSMYRGRLSLPISPRPGMISPHPVLFGRCS